MTHAASQCWAWPCFLSSCMMHGTRPQRRWSMEGGQTLNSNTINLRETAATHTPQWDQSTPGKPKKEGIWKAWTPNHITFEATEFRVKLAKSPWPRESSSCYCCFLPYKQEPYAIGKYMDIIHVCIYVFSPICNLESSYPFSKTSPKFPLLWF